MTNVQVKNNCIKWMLLMTNVQVKNNCIKWMLSMSPGKKLNLFCKTLKGMNKNML
jgi:elongation factor P hydroxylase